MLDDDRPGVLLVICPEQRVRLLLNEVREQMLDPERPVELGPLSRSAGLWRSHGAEFTARVIMLHWELLLQRRQAAADEFAIQADIQRLRGLMPRINHEASPQPSAEMAAPDFRARDDHLRRMVRDPVGRGWRAGWTSLRHQSCGPTSSYHRCFFSVPAAPPPRPWSESARASPYRRHPVHGGRAGSSASNGRPPSTRRPVIHARHANVAADTRASSGRPNGRVCSRGRVQESRLD